MSKRKWNSKSYILLEGDLPHKASSGREFIYIVLLNRTATGAHPPIYVDKAANLFKRLSKHAVVNWHNKNHQNPPIVKVLGTVQQEYATKAVEDLEQKLLDRSISLYKRVINWGERRIDTFSPDELDAYLDNLDSDYEEVISQWKKRWKPKQKALPQQLAIKGRDQSNKAVISLEQLITREQVVKKIRTRIYSMLTTTKVAQKLSKTFNSETKQGYYDFWLPGNPERQKFRRGLFKQYQKDLSNDWVFIEEIILEHGDEGAQKIRVVFKLSDSISRSILKSSS